MSDTTKAPKAVRCPASNDTRRCCRPVHEDEEHDFRYFAHPDSTTQWWTPPSRRGRAT